MPSICIIIYFYSMSEDQEDFTATQDQLISLFGLLRDGSKALFDKRFEPNQETISRAFDLLFWGKLHFCNDMAIRME